ncbi:hypothetical protein ACHAWO_003501 [Cyclotella atomus]|jgi:RING finger protein 113A|uniref:RING-type E3 ubiquitin transferase n=1 Tax=Cyclotella atomus TaxID=382360 RepID=A0ABD3PIF3_9STRA
MFKKPKKKPTALRSVKAAEEGTSSPTATKRPRSDSSSSKEEGDTTADLLHQLRQEQKSSKKAHTSSTSAKSNNNLMQQYKSTNDALTAQQMATRSAEHHPVQNDSNNNDKSGNINGSNDKSGGDVAINKDLPSFTKEKRNPFLAGPIKVSTSIRSTTRFDYQPDICKDYKETGFCGYGDTCIYLHDRGDTKTGWEMEREYEEKKKQMEEEKSKEVERFMREMMDGGGKVNREEDGLNEKEEIEDDGIPFACHICRSHFKDPIVTPCHHYFCQGCMSKRVKEVGTGCPVCGKDMHGVLNHPRALVAKKRRLCGREGDWEEYYKMNVS